MRKILVVLLCVLAPFTIQAQTIANGEGQEAIVSYSGLEVQPEFPGGMNAFFMYVNESFRVPDVDHDLTAKIYVSFVIEKDGTMTGQKILRDPGFGLGAEAVRVLQACKEKWKPGTIHGLPVRSSYNLPITINVKSETSKQPQPADSVGENKIYTAAEADLAPQYPGGKDQLFKFINKNYKVPKVKQAVSAKILIDFVVEIDGSLTNFEVSKSPGKEFSDEAIRVLKLCGKWKPGMMGKKPVRTAYTVPIVVNANK